MVILDGDGVRRSAKAADIVEAFRCFKEEDRFWILRMEFEEMGKSPALRRKALDVAVRALDPGAAIESWMEGRFRSDMRLKPKQVVAEAIKIKRVAVQYRPYLMRLANAVKHRLYVRDSRAYGRNGRFRAEGWPEREGMLSCSYRLSASEENPRCWRLNRTLEALLYKI